LIQHNISKQKTACEPQHRTTDVSASAITALTHQYIYDLHLGSLSAMLSRMVNICAEFQKIPQKYRVMQNTRRRTTDRQMAYSKT